MSIRRTTPHPHSQNLLRILESEFASGSPDDSTAGEAVDYLARAGCASTTLYWWLLSYLGIARPEPTRIPVASVLDGSHGIITALSLCYTMAAPPLAPGMVPDLEAALTPTRTDLLDALGSAIPPGLTRSVAWHVIRPADLRISNIGGSSLQGAAAVALHLMEGGQAYRSGILVLGEVRDSRLVPVGHEHLKLLAAVESYGLGRTSRYAAEEESSIQLVILSEESACDIQPALDRGLPLKRAATVGEAAAIIVDAGRTVEGNRYQIARSVRRIVAMPPPPKVEYSVDTAGGPVAFGPDSRIDYISEVHFHAANRCRDPYPLHYRVQSFNSLVEADCYPEADNLCDDVTYQNYLDLKKYFVFQFRPGSGARYMLHARIFNGFEAGRRNIHCHFPDTAKHDLLVFELDLRAYGSGHPRLTVCEAPFRPPRLSIWRSQDPSLAGLAGRTIDAASRLAHRKPSGCDRFCEMARASPALAPCSVERGSWRWEIETVAYGAVLWVDWEDVVVQKDETR